MARLLRLFDEENEVVIPVTICRYDTLWQASIAGGWWIAYGKTAEEAKKNVVKRYRDEVEYFLDI